jgi:hypothetical protein
VTSLHGTVTSSSGELKEVVFVLEAVTAKAAVPIDQAISDAVVASGAMFEAKVAEDLPAWTGGMDTLWFEASRSIVALPTELVTRDRRPLRERRARRARVRATPLRLDCGTCRTW